MGASVKDRSGLGENQGEREQHARYRSLPVPPAKVPSFHARESSPKPHALDTAAHAPISRT